MLQSEFAYRMGHKVTEQEYVTADAVYNESEMDKDAFCAIWKTADDATRTLLSELAHIANTRKNLAAKHEDQLVELLKEIEKYKDLEVRNEKCIKSLNGLIDKLERRVKDQMQKEADSLQPTLDKIVEEYGDGWMSMVEMRNRVEKACDLHLSMLFDQPIERLDESMVTGFKTQALFYIFEQISK